MISGRSSTSRGMVSFLGRQSGRLEFPGLEGPYYCGCNELKLPWYTKKQARSARCQLIQRFDEPTKCTDNIRGLGRRCMEVSQVWLTCVPC